MEKKQIYELLPLVARDIGAVGKDGKNTQQGYSYRAIDDVLNAAHTALVKHQITAVPQVIEQKREERTTGKGTVLIYSVLTVRYNFYAPDGSGVECVVVGEGMDSGDKSSNKAMSAAYKYAIGQVFSIPFDTADSEKDSPEPAPKPAAKPAPAQPTPPSAADIEAWHLRWQGYCIEAGVAPDKETAMLLQWEKEFIPNGLDGAMLAKLMKNPDTGASRRVEWIKKNMEAK
jgi:hypothetical protein